MMRLNKYFYKTTDFYFGLVMIAVPVVGIVVNRNPYDNILLGLLVIIGLVFFGHALLSAEATDWLISGQGRRLGFNRHFYRTVNFYLGWFLILTYLPGSGPLQWDNLTFLVLGVVMAFCSLLYWHN